MHQHLIQYSTDVFAQNLCSLSVHRVQLPLCQPELIWWGHASWSIATGYAFQLLLTLIWFLNCWLCSPSSQNWLPDSLFCFSSYFGIALMFSVIGLLHWGFPGYSEFDDEDLLQRRGPQVQIRLEDGGCNLWREYKLPANIYLPHPVVRYYTSDNPEEPDTTGDFSPHSWKW